MSHSYDARTHVTLLTHVVSFEGLWEHEVYALTEAEPGEKPILVQGICGDRWGQGWSNGWNSFKRVDIIPLWSLTRMKYYYDLNLAFDQKYPLQLIPKQEP